MLNKLFLFLTLRIRSLFALRSRYNGRSIKVDFGVILDEQTEINDYTYIGVNTIISNCEIGRYCSIGPFCAIGLGEHDYTLKSTSKYHSAQNLLNKRTVIENDVWFGAHVIIRQGVKISNGCVIGANSVVLKDTVPYGIYVGSPAKLKGYRFDEQEISILLNSKWWEN